MKTGSARIAWGIALTTLFGLGTLRDLVVVPLGVAAHWRTSYLIGTIVGALLVVALLVASIRLLRSGLEQRRAFQHVIRQPLPQSNGGQGFQ